MDEFWLALLVGMLVQTYKGVREYLKARRWNFRRFVETGGMPSSHAASVAALSTLVGLREGVRSPLFGVTLYFSLVVMYDAAGLRRAAGRQGLFGNAFRYGGPNRGMTMACSRSPVRPPTRRSSAPSS